MRVSDVEIVKNKTKRIKITCKMSESRIQLTIIGLLSVSTVALMSYVIYSETKTTEVQDNPKIETEGDVIFHYGDFFKTPSEQTKYQSEFFRDKTNSQPAKQSNDTDPSKYDYVCKNATTTTTSSTTVPAINTNWADFKPTNTKFSRNGRKRRSRQSYYIEPEEYHGCCTSHRKFVSPPVAKSDHDYSVLTIVHFDYERQYFLSEDCSHNYKCKMDCGCHQQAGLHRALVYNPAFNPGDEGIIPKYVVRTIRIAGGCKCLNGITPPSLWSG